MAFIAALILRANLATLVGLQLISNPFTLPVIYQTAYNIGLVFLGNFSDTNQMTQVTGIEEQTSLFREGFYRITATMVGGIVIGLCVGLLLSAIYKIVAIGTSRTLIRMRATRDGGAGPKKQDSTIREELDSMPP